MLHVVLDSIVSGAVVPVVVLVLLDPIKPVVLFQAQVALNAPLVVQPLPPAQPQAMRVIYPCVQLVNTRLLAVLVV